MPTITIDGLAYQANEGDNILQACLSLGLDLPYFCWHPAMGSIGACRQCAVVQFQNEDDTRGRIVMGCMTPVTDGARFSLGGDKASTFRRHIVESLMLNHPHDCPVCAEGGECHLQDMTVMVGHRDRHYRGRKNTHRNQYLGPLIHHEMNRCITCYRCTRYYRDYAGGDDLAAMAAHDHVYFGRHREGILENEFAGNLVEVCPTGVFTDKALVHGYTRKWDLQSAPSICVGCAVGCNTMPGERYGNLKRIHNRFNVEVNGYFLCDRGRFGAGFVNSAQRLDYAGARNADGSYDAIQARDALQQTGDCLQGSHKLAAIGSPRASLEANFLLQQLVGVSRCSPGFSDTDHRLIPFALQILRTSQARIASLQEIESADAVLVLGEDVTQTAPRIALALRQSVRNKAYALAAELKLAPWQDAAVRNLAQDQRSPLDSFISGDSKLDDIARHCSHCSPEDIAGHADAIAAAIRAGTSSQTAVGTSSHTADGTLPKDAGGNSSKDADGTSSRNTGGAVSKHIIAEIAQSLVNARRPLIVSGTGAQSHGVLEAAAALTEALLAVNPATMLSLSVPECNSLGAAMLATDESPSIDSLAERAAAGDIDTLVILENDLSRRCSSQTQGLLFDNIPNIIALDALDNATVSRAAWVLPCATFADGQGSFVSSEGRAQRHFPVFAPTLDRQPSWAWLLQLGSSAQIEAFSSLRHFDDVSAACTAAYSHLAKLGAAAPPHDFVNKGLKIPRQAHRYSGRTAIGSNVSVHEPQQAADAESPLAYTMEGLNRDQGGSLLPFVWSPGWNSNQSVHKFQSEVAGPLRGGTAGVRLLDDAAADRQPGSKSQPEPEPSGPWLLIPRYRIFGSDELSAQTDSIAELAGNAYLELNPNDAQTLGLSAGDGLCLGSNPAIEVHLNSSLPDGCIGYTAGFSDTLALVAGTRVAANKALDWVRPPGQLIGTDRGRSDV
jgi:NADH-quinone oxidoreductase subunit G